MSKTLSLHGETLSYEDEGTGRPVILVHGNPSWSFYFRHLTAALSANGMRAIAPDHIGMGRSSKPALHAYNHTVGQRISDLGELIDSLNLDGPIDLVAHDWGGAIAMGWATEHIDRVGKLVMMNTAAFPLPTDKKLPLALRAARVPVLGKIAVRDLNAFSLAALVMGTGQKILPKEARDGLLKPYKGRANRTAVHAFVQDIPLKPTDQAYPVLQRMRERLPLLEDKPLQIFWGMKDFVFDDVVLREWEHIFPHAEVHRYQSAGHFVLEDAGDRIVPEVVRFLSLP